MFFWSETSSSSNLTKLIPVHMTKSSLLNLTMPPILSDSTHKVNLTVFGQVASENFLFIRKQLQRKFFFVHTYIEILERTKHMGLRMPGTM